MLLNELKLKNFRNIKEATLTASEKVNIIYGENAQGKTNILEAIWLFSGNKSFRGAKDQNLINTEKEFARLEMKFYESKRNQTASIIFAEKKTVKLNEVKLDSIKKLNGKIIAVCFSPNELSIIKGGPAFRRKFLDDAIIQMSNTYSKYVNVYDRLLKQRNALLKDIKYSTKNYNTLEIWDEKLVNAGSKIAYQRKEFLKEILNKTKVIYFDLSDEKEQSQIKIRSDYLDSSMNEKEIKESFAKKLKENIQNDIEFGNTGVGPHRDDFDFLIDEKNAKEFGSQGQQRSGAISLKLAEAELLYEKTGKKPLILLDDVLSELDIKRQNYILNKISDRQIFLTCCELTDQLKKHANNIYKIESGKICTYS